MSLRKLFVSLSLCSVLLGGCATFGSSSQEEETVNPYFTAEFSDVQMPQELKENRSSTMITYAPTGAKYGVQVFSGRVDTVYIMNSMRRGMAGDGWSLRSALRTKNSIMIFEKGDRIASIIINEGTLSTTVHVFVSPRLDGDNITDIGGSSFNAPSKFE